MDSNRRTTQIVYYDDQLDNQDDDSSDISSDLVISDDIDDFNQMDSFDYTDHDDLDYNKCGDSYNLDDDQYNIGDDQYNIGDDQYNIEDDFDGFAYHNKGIHSGIDSDYNIDGISDVHDFMNNRSSIIDDDIRFDNDISFDNKFDNKFDTNIEFDVSLFKSFKSTKPRKSVFQRILGDDVEESKNNSTTASSEVNDSDPIKETTVFEGIPGWDVVDPANSFRKKSKFFKKKNKTDMLQVDNHQRYVPKSTNNTQNNTQNNTRNKKNKKTKKLDKIKPKNEFLIECDLSTNNIMNFMLFGRFDDVEGQNLNNKKELNYMRIIHEINVLTEDDIDNLSEIINTNFNTDNNINLAHLLNGFDENTVNLETLTLDQSLIYKIYSASYHIRLSELGMYCLNEIMRLIDSNITILYQKDCCLTNLQKERIYMLYINNRVLSLNQVIELYENCYSNSKRLNKILEELIINENNILNILAVTLDDVAIKTHDKCLEWLFDQPNLFDELKYTNHYKNLEDRHKVYLDNQYKKRMGESYHWKMTQVKVSSVESYLGY